MSTFHHIAIIVAAGMGLRMGSSQKKQYLDLGGVPVLSRTLQAFAGHEQIHQIILVVPSADRAYCREFMVHPFEYRGPLHLVDGGDTRQASVFNGVVKARELSQAWDRTLVLIHDGVRPFVERQLITDCLEIAQDKGACIPALKISDTVKQLLDPCQISKTLDRDLLCQAQTPQVFRLDLVLTAFEHARATAYTGTDDASLLEHAGIPVFVTKGSVFNIKLTTPEDLRLGRYLLDTLPGKESQGRS